MRILRFSRVLTVLLIGMLGGLYACEKAELQEDSVQGSKSLNEVLRRVFADEGFEKSLIQPFHDTAQIYWEPNWKGGYTKKSAKGERYTFVPLKARLYATKKNAEYKLTMVGVWRFILIKHTQSKDLFYLATYIAAQEKLPAQVAIARPFNFATFNGALTLQGLSLNENAIVIYKNGKSAPLPAKVSSKQESGNQVNKTAGEVCENYYTCYWYAGCDEGGMGTTTYGIDSCSEPGWEPCNNWGNSWYQNGYTVNEQCHWVDDPPPPGDDGHDGTGDDDNTPIDPNSPCGQMAALGAQPVFGQAVNTLIGQTGLNHETGYMYWNKGLSGSNYQTLSGAANALEIANPNPPFPLDGYMHTHNPGVGSLSIFSSSDLAYMYGLKSKNQMMDPATFTLTVFTDSGDDYAIKIADLAQFLSFGSQYLTDKYAVAFFEDVYINDRPGKYNLADCNSNSVNELIFLRMLKDLNMGLKLFKHDRASDTWQERGLNQSNVPTNIPCQ